MAEYRITKGSIHERFLASKAKIQIFAGGFANGKTAALCVKSIQVARDYPGANILIARSTLSKLKDTVQMEFMKWLPSDWIHKTNNSPHGMTVLLTNGTTINFRYVQQQGKKQGSTSSNLLSANYDLIAVDQLDDPQFSSRDFVDLLGRLRSGTKYVGTDPTMPMSGPRWLLFTLNPTRNWVYRELIRHVLMYNDAGQVSAKLQQMLADYQTNKVEDFIELFQGSTRENAHNLGEDYLRSLEATYSDVMKERFIEGKWGAFKGLVYPMFDEFTNMVDGHEVLHWKRSIGMQKYIESFDYGLRAPMCYLLFFQDDNNNIVCVDGFKEGEVSPEDAVGRIKQIRRRWAVPLNSTRSIYADPSMFRRSASEYRTVGKSVVDVFKTAGDGVIFGRGNNDIVSGITKTRMYLMKHANHPNPFTYQRPSPYLFFNRDTVSFIEDEIVDYYFENPDDEGETKERPKDGNDHAMDALKYGLTGAPDVAKMVRSPPRDLEFLTKWTVRPEEGGHGRPARYS